MSWRARYDEAAARLGSKVEARWIVEEAASGTWPLLLDEAVSERAQRYFDQMVARRATGEPLQYVLGRWGFRQLDLLVNQQVLIPRPETEQVVEVALRELASLEGAGGAAGPVGGGGAAGPVGGGGAVGPVGGGGAVGPVGGGAAGPVVVDLGTGSGAIALSLAAEGTPGAVWATDVCPEALAIARANLVGLGGSRAAKVRLVEGSWWDALPASLRGQVSLVISNPPYVTTAEMASLPAVVSDWEPALALDGGPMGLDAIAVIVSEAPGWLARPGVLVVELAPDQAAEAAALARRAGFDDVGVVPDLTGRDRALVARLRAVS
ncbi:MAG: release factor glutamine methyltransferase [Acidimicrobiaceae bacterium]|nr:release factor glutamine methyltransferase [Acidimicrobiaceae bacterium]